MHGVSIHKILLLFFASFFVLGACSSDVPATSTDTVVTATANSNPVATRDAPLPESRDVPAAKGSVVPSKPAPGEMYAIGDVGPGGGIVFITPSTTGNSTGQYFEVAPFVDFDDTTRAVWCDAKTLLGVSGTRIGTGASNTALAATACSSGANSLSAKYANDGASDWFLPSKDELNEMYKNIDIIGGFSIVNYWSSSENDASLAVAQGFGPGNENFNIKDDMLYFRPVRSFA